LNWEAWSVEGKGGRREGGGGGKGFDRNEGENQSLRRLHSYEFSVLYL